jgi:ABC-type molybdate transport system substrate-binding protein
VVHHRETPLRLSLGTADAGPVWATEVLSAIARGEKVSGVDIPEAFDMSDEVTYYAAVLNDAPNPGTGWAFLEYLLSGEAQDLFSSHGFVRFG